MAAEAIQNFEHHARWDPPFHFFVLPVFAITWIAALVLVIRHPSTHYGTRLVLATAALVALVKVRTNSLKVQDRVIRLEERLRLEALSPESFRSKIDSLTESQLIGLRFASDEEVAALAERALSENLSRTDIKKSIRNWRPDRWRV